KEKNVKFILDSSGDSLKLALDSKPYLIKPNTHELEALTKIRVTNIDDAIIAARKLLSTGAKNVCVSMGKDGMILLNENELYIVQIPKIDVINTVGSGDSCIAGFAYGLLKGYDFEKTLKLANACGMSNAMHLATGDINLDHIDKLVKEIKVESYICKKETQI
ncbi:MAG: 1-phosphofructokinase family hexose kinase, partial [Paraclostridium sp.]